MDHAVDDPAGALIARNRLLLAQAAEARWHTRELRARAAAHRSRGGEMLGLAQAMQQQLTVLLRPVPPFTLRQPFD